MSGNDIFEEWLTQRRIINGQSDLVQFVLIWFCQIEMSVSFSDSYFRQLVALHVYLCNNYSLCSINNATPCRQRGSVHLQVLIVRYCQTQTMWCTSNFNTAPVGHVFRLMTKLVPHGLALNWFWYTCFFGWSTGFLYTIEIRRNYGR